MKVLFIGGNRFVGKALAERFIDFKMDVTVFNRKGTGPKGAEIIKGDRNNKGDLEKVKFINYDIVIDFCLFKPEQFELFREYIFPIQKYIFISSASVGRPEWGAYGTEKEDCEALVKDYFRNFIIVRPPYIDGPNSHRARTSQIINQIENNIPVTIAGDGEYTFNITWVDDVVRFLSHIVESNWFNNEVVELGNAEQFTMKEYIKLIADFLGKDYEIAYDSKPFWAPAYDLGVEKNDHSHNFKPVSEKLQELYDWYNEIGKEKYGY